LETPIARHWLGGDPFKTAVFNALSFSFPFGEQFFIDSVREGTKALPPDAQEHYAIEVQNFVAQEAIHRQVHRNLNTLIFKHGYTDLWTDRAKRRVELMRDADPRHALAVTAANEHYTAILGTWILANEDILSGCESRLSDLWKWHSAEENEHKATAFDLYQALGGNHEWRMKWFWRTTIVFLGDLAHQTWANLKRDGVQWHWRTWVSAAQLCFGKSGIVRTMFKHWKAYLRPDFHPSQLTDDLSERWLTANRQSYSLVSR